MYSFRKGASHLREFSLCHEKETCHKRSFILSFSCFQDPTGRIIETTQCNNNIKIHNIEYGDFFFPSPIAYITVCVCNKRSGKTAIFGLRCYTAGLNAKSKQVYFVTTNKPKKSNVKFVLLSIKSFLIIVGQSHAERILHGSRSRRYVRNVYT